MIWDAPTRRSRRVASASALPGVASSMWSASRMRRPSRLTRRHFLRLATVLHRAHPTDEIMHTEYVFTRTELQLVLGAIQASLGFGAVPLDSPQRLQDALTSLIANLGGRGEVEVRRSPAALLTPEYWQVGLVGLDEPTHAALLD